MTARTLLAALGLLLLAPATGTAQQPKVHRSRETGNLAIHARAILKRYCAECHDGGPKSRGTINVLDHENLLKPIGPGRPVTFIDPMSAKASQVIQFIEDGSMPPGRRAGPDGKEIGLLKEWIAAFAPKFPARFDEETTLQTVLGDAEAQPAGDLPYVRYFSFDYMLRDREPNDPDKSDPRSLVGLYINNLQTKVFPTLARAAGADGRNVLVPLNDTFTVFRLDTRQIGWGNAELFESVKQGAPGGVFSLTPHDLLLFEYPYGSRLLPGHRLEGKLNEYIAKAKLVRPIPYLRGDWVNESLTGRPLLADLIALGELGATKQGAKLPCGPSASPFRLTTAPLPTIRVTAERPILPLSAWYSGYVEAMPPPFTLTTQLVDERDQPFKGPIPKGTPFRLRVELGGVPQVNFVLLQVLENGSITPVATNKGGVLKDKDVLSPKEPQGGKDAFVINSFLGGGPTTTEYFVLLASPTPLPEPIIVRSKHASGPDCEKLKKFPIHRFLLPDPEPGKKSDFDPAKVVRRVIPISLVKGD